VSANLYGQSLGDVTAKVQQLIDAEAKTAAYEINLGGAAEDMAETAVNALVGILLGLVFIYLILGSLFNSFSLPLTIMTSLPLSLIGVIFGLYLSGSTLNVFSIIGFIMLMGLVTKNSILLVDFINDGIKAGDSVHDAVVNSGITRLKPIVMTTLAMIFGMLPLALGVGEGSEQRAPMAHAIIGGLITSTLLTLVVVPVLYTMLHKTKAASGGEVDRL
jgi:HAE1 family hydrophobic/amphiphilic exporter-1